MNAPLRSLAIAGFALALALPASAQECGPLRGSGQYGPYDYRTDKDKLPVVEDHHFTPVVETLVRGQEGTLGSDLDYTLRAFPNHSRALVAMMKLGEKEKTARPAGANYPVECYFERAMQFRPTDRAVRVIYADYLGKTGKKTEAINQLLGVQEMDGPKNPYVPYEIGLLYFDLGDFEKSLAFAHRAYRQGATLEGLKNRLLRAGKWRDPPADAPAATRPRGPAQAKQRHGAQPASAQP